jgi:GT2 family glycosyltransferase
VIDSVAIDQPAVYVVLVNWNGWRDTIECLESLLRLHYPRFTVIVCDNGSTDGSMENIERWAEGKLAASPAPADISHLTSPPIPKPIGLTKWAAGERRGAADNSRSSLMLIEVGSNRGFAGGNNVGIRYALEDDSCDYVWLLNNDTIVEPNSLTELVRTSQADRHIGICGSLLRTYAPPHEVQTAGRAYNRWTGRTQPLADSDGAEQSASGYIVEGASMLVSRRFLEEVGLLNEEYFLFFEELDWVTRSKSAFRFVYSRASVVYHKVGASTGSSMERGARSTLSDFYQARNRLVFTRNYYPWCLPTVFAAVAASAVERALNGRRANAVAVFRGILASFRRNRSGGQASH